MPRKRPSKGSDLQGNAWAFGSVNDVRAVYQTALAKPGIISNTHDSSLETGFFASRPVLVFRWGPTMDPELVASVQRLAVLVGGHELQDALKQELLRQARVRWRAMRSQRPRGGPITKQHPQGKSGRMCGTDVGW